MSANAQKYSKPAIILHWLVGILILVMFAIGWFMAELPKDAPKIASLDMFDLGIYTMQFTEEITPRTFYFNLHKSIGVTVLMLVLLRIYVRFSHAAPAFPATMKIWEIRVADLVHKGLYVLMVAMPLTGVAMSLNSKFGIKWFGIQLLGGVDNKEMRELFVVIHEVIGLALMVMIVLHVAAAIKHKVIDKDEVMQRMSLH
jgi:cytochrome b561